MPVYKGQEAASRSFQTSNFNLNDMSYLFSILLHSGVLFLFYDSDLPVGF